MAPLNFKRQVELNDLGQLLVFVDPLSNLRTIKRFSDRAQLIAKYVQVLLDHAYVRSMKSFQEYGIQVELKIVIGVVAAICKASLHDVQDLAVLRDRARISHLLHKVVAFGALAVRTRAHIIFFFHVG